MSEKASNEDLNNALHRVDQLFERLLQLSTLNIETVKTMLPGKTASSMRAEETTQARIQRVKKLLSTAELADKWIRNFKNGHHSNPNMTKDAASIIENEFF